MWMLMSLSACWECESMLCWCCYSFHLVENEFRTTLRTKKIDNLTNSTYSGGFIGLAVSFLSLKMFVQSRKGAEARGQTLSMIHHHKMWFLSNLREMHFSVFLLQFLNCFKMCICVLVDGKVGGEMRKMSLDLIKQIFSSICTEKHAVSRFVFTATEYKMNKYEMHKIPSSWKCCCLSFLLLPALTKHFDAHLQSVYDGLFSCLSPHIPHHVLGDGKEVKVRGGESYVVGLAWGDVETRVQLREARGRKGRTKKNGEAKSVLYFYRVHSPSCPSEFPLHVFLNPTDGNKMNLEVQLSWSFRKKEMGEMNWWVWWRTRRRRKRFHSSMEGYKEKGEIGLKDVQERKKSHILKQLKDNGKKEGRKSTLKKKEKRNESVHWREKSKRFFCQTN